MKTQICVITGQPLANLVPLLYFKPEKVIILVTQSFKGKAKSFKEILKDLDITDSIYLVDGCPDTGLSQIGDFIKNKLLPILPEASCDFNITGGTKMHSFSLYEELKNRGFDDRFIYIDTQNRLIEYYPTVSMPSSNEPLPSVLTAKMTLTGMGKSFIKSESNNDDWVCAVRQRESFTRFIANHITDNDVQNLIGGINDLVNKAYSGGKKDVLFSKDLQLYQHPKKKAVLFLEQAHDLGLMTWSGGKNISFSHYRQSRYLTGAWLEEYVWLIAQDIGFEEIYSGLEFGNMGESIEKNRAKNEIDLFVQHANSALAIECKSAKGATHAEASQDMFHKLSGVASRAGGLMCSKLFVSAFPLRQKDGRDIASVYHAKEQEIKIIQAAELVSELPKILDKWKQRGKF